MLPKRRTFVYSADGQNHKAQINIVKFDGKNSETPRPK